MHCLRSTHCINPNCQYELYIPSAILHLFIGKFAFNIDIIRPMSSLVRKQTDQWSNNDRLPGVLLALSSPINSEIEWADDD